MKSKIKFLLLSFFILSIFLLSGCDIEVVINPSGQGSGGVSAGNSNAALTVSFIDVGQGDATLIECGGEAMLIDASIFSQGKNVVSYINRQGIADLKYCVATHPHSDHIGGMSQVIYNVDVNTLVYPLVDSDSSLIYNVLDACDEKGVAYLNPEPFDTLTLGSATITVLSPEAYADYKDVNNSSLVLKLEYEDVSFMFTGDAEDVVEQELLDKHIDLSADVLKAGHHGSSSSSTPEFVKKVNPDFAVISCGAGNDYGHPHSETLTTFEQNNIKVLRTDQLGTIVATSDGETISFSSADYGEIETMSKAETESTSASIAEYIGNKNSKVFHTSECGSVTNMKDKNKVYFDTRNQATDKDYKPCQSCNP